MKKNKIVAIITIAVVSFLTFNFENKQNNNISSLKVKNTEALANTVVVDKECYYQISGIGENNPTHVTYCSDCSAHLAKVYLYKFACGTINYE